MKKINYVISLLIMMIFCLNINAQPFNGSLSLDGIDDYVEISATILPDTSDFTVEFYFNLCAFTSTSYLFDNRGSTGGSGIQIRFTSDTNLNIQMQGYGGVSEYSNDNFTVPVTIGNWHHFSFTHSRTDSINVFYIDGNIIDTIIHDFKSYPKFTIGKADYTTSGYFDGTMDEFRISNTVRYQTNFTPPSSELTNDINTILFH